MVKVFYFLHYHKFVCVLGGGESFYCYGGGESFWSFVSFTSLLPCSSDTLESLLNVIMSVFRASCSSLLAVNMEVGGGKWGWAFHHCFKQNGCQGLEHRWSILPLHIGYFIILSIHCQNMACLSPQLPNKAAYISLQLASPVHLPPPPFSYSSL